MPTEEQRKAAALAEALCRAFPKDPPPNSVFYHFSDHRIPAGIERARERLSEFAIATTNEALKLYALRLVDSARRLLEEIGRQHTAEALIGGQDWSEYCRLLRELEREVKEGPGVDHPPLEKEDLALALLVQNPTWSVRRIAEVVGVNRSTPYKWPRFRQAWKLAQQAGAIAPLEGFRTKEGNIEAFDE